MEMLPEMPCNIEELDLSAIAIKELPLSIKYISRLILLYLHNLKGFKSLPSSICKWKSLKTLKLSHCLKLDKLPNDIGTLESLKVL
ncbi:hypothetical protein ACOSP7_031963 [Xanthoceras sorbifolium]